jgi:hypothetical protein
MAEANDDINSTEPTLPGAMAWIRRTASELALGGMEKRKVSFGNALGGGLGTMPGFGFAGLDSERWNWRISGQLEVSFSSLLFSSLIGSRPGTNGVGMGFYYLPLVVEFPVRQIHRKATLEWYRSVAGFMRPYEGVRAWIFISLLLFSLLMYGYGSPGGLQLERGMM